MKRLWMLAAVCLAVAGCASTAAPGARETSYVSYLGDRNAMSLRELVMSLPLADSENVFDYLHIELTLVAPRAGGEGIADAATSYQVSEDYHLSAIAGLGRRMAPRIHAAILAELMPTDDVTFKGLATLRARAAEVANREFQAVYKRWKYAADYKPEFLVTGFYLTSDISTDDDSPSPAPLNRAP